MLLCLIFYCCFIIVIIIIISIIIIIIIIINVIVIVIVMVIVIVIAPPAGRADLSVRPESYSVFSDLRSESLYFGNIFPDNVFYWLAYLKGPPTHSRFVQTLDASKEGGTLRGAVT